MPPGSDSDLYAHTHKSKCPPGFRAQPPARVPDAPTGRSLQRGHLLPGATVQADVSTAQCPAVGSSPKVRELQG